MLEQSTTSLSVNASIFDKKPQGIKNQWIDKINDYTAGCRKLENNNPR